MPKTSPTPNAAPVASGDDGPNHPYRGASAPRLTSKAGLLDGGDLALNWALVGVGLVPVLSPLLHGGVWGREPSLGLLIVGFAARSLVVHYGRMARRALAGRG